MKNVFPDSVVGMCKNDIFAEQDLLFLHEGGNSRGDVSLNRIYDVWSDKVMNELCKMIDQRTGKSIIVFRGHPIHLLPWPELIELVNQALMTPTPRHIWRDPRDFQLCRRKVLLGTIETVMKLREYECV